MKINLFTVCVSLISIFSPATQAAGTLEQTDLLAQRGSGQLTQAEFAAHLDKIPPNIRDTILRDGTKLKGIINTLLVNGQLAADARKNGFAGKQIVVDRMRLAAEAELADAWMEYYVITQPPANYEQLAHEYYQVNAASMISPPMINVSHILISSEGRSPPEARELADSLSIQLADDPSKFDQFVKQYSEDPSVATNAGKFKLVKKGDMVKPFEQAAFALQQNEISAPVKTSYGYHIIRLDAHIAAKVKSFDELKAPLMEQERQRHNDRVKQDYLSALTSLNVSLSQQAFDEMLRRQLGENSLELELGSVKTE